MVDERRYRERVENHPANYRWWCECWDPVPGFMGVECKRCGRGIQEVLDARLRAKEAAARGR